MTQKVMHCDTLVALKTSNWKCFETVFVGSHSSANIQQLVHNSVYVCRYLSDYIDVLPLGIVTRMVKANDTLMALIPLFEDPPWVRRRNKKVEKYIGNVWTAVEPKDRLRITQHDAQVR